MLSRPAKAAVGTAAGTSYTAAMQWKKSPGDQWICRVPPDARFTLKAFPKGDGRWSWAVFSGTSENPMATGNAGNLGAAKGTAEQFLKGAGYA